MTIKWNWILLILALTFISCEQDYFFKETYVVENQIWNYDNLAEFSVEIPDTNSIYNLYLKVKHSTDYPFQNLYTKIKTEFPQGQVVDEIVSLELAGKGGIWLGNCNSKTCELIIPVRQNDYFVQSGKYLFSIEQYMRQDTLPGVYDFTFMVENIGKRKM